MHRRLKLLSIVAVAVFILATAGLSGLSVTADNRILLSPTDPNVIALNEFEDTFAAQNNIGLVLRCSNGPTDKCRRLLPLTIKKLTQTARSIPFVTRVDSISTYPILRSHADVLSTSNIVDLFCNPSCPNDGFDGIVLPPGALLLTNSTATAMAVSIGLDFDVSDTDAVQSIYDSIEQALHEASIPSEITHHIVGRVPLMQAFVDATNSELTGYMGLALVLIFLLTYLVAGSVYLATTIIGLSVITILSTLGVAGWFGFVISTASAALPTIILTLVTATSMHYFMHVIRTMSEDSTRNQATIAFGAAEYQLKPTLITAVTTICAMLSLTSVESPPFQSIGIWTAVALVFGCLYLFTIVPFVVSRLPRLPKSHWQNLIQPVFNRHARNVGQNGRLSLALILCSIVLGAAATTLSIDDDFVRYFGNNTKYRLDTEIVSAELFGPTNLEIVIDAAEPDGVFRPEYLHRLEQIANEIRKLPEVSHVNSLIDVLDQVSPHLLQGKDWRIESGESIAQLVFAYEMSLEDGQSINDFVSSPHDKARISLVAGDLSSHEIIELESKLRAILGKTEYMSTITGEALPLSYLSSKNLPGILKSLAATIALTSILLALYFKDIRMGMILFGTTVVPVVCGFGFWSVLADTIGLATTVILSLCIGVVVDDSIHLLYRYQDGLKRLELSPNEAAAYTIYRTGSAILTTTLILSVGFGVLAFSDFAINRTFGLSTVIILIIALVVDLIILPYLLLYKQTDRTENAV